MTHAAGTEPILSVSDLSIELTTRRGPARVVDRASLIVNPGESVGLVGESGSGKSLTAIAAVRLLPRVARVIEGGIALGGHDLISMSEREVQGIRGGTVGFVFQNARAALSPLMKVGSQIARVAETHRGVARRDAWQTAEELLGKVGIGDPARVATSYPHQLSGGMAQRALIAAVLAARPSLLIADEPTTGLDATTEVQIFDLLQSLRRELNLSLLLITHDLALVAENCDRVVVMHAGHTVETGSARQIFRNPLHPYTRGLLASLPRPDRSYVPIEVLRGHAPDPLTVAPEGCRFAARCAQRMPACAEPIHAHIAQPEPGHRVMCRLYD